MKLRLIEIAQDGSPARCPGHLPPAARDAIEGTVNLYESEGFHPPWVGYLADRDGEVVGSCAFTSPPHDGRVEIAGQTFSEFASRGIGAEMTRLMVQLARGAEPEVEIAVEAPADAVATGLLRKLGFAPDARSTHWILRP